MLLFLFTAFSISWWAQTVKQIKDGCATPPETPRPTKRLINYGTVQSPSPQIIGIITLKTPLNINQLLIYDGWLSFHKKSIMGESVVIGKLMVGTVLVMRAV